MMTRRGATMIHVFIFAVFLMVTSQLWGAIQLLDAPLKLAQATPSPTPSPAPLITGTSDPMTPPPTPPPTPGSILAKYQIISSFYYLDNTNEKTIVSVSFGKPNGFISVPYSVQCCILKRQTLERSHTQTKTSPVIVPPLTECIRLAPLQTFPRSNHEGECEFPFLGGRKDIEIAYFDDKTKWAVMLMDTFNNAKDLRLDATMPLMRSPDRPWTKKPIYKFSFATELRNVENTIEELIVYQFLIGFDHGYVYDDGSTDRTKDILQTYAYEGLITLEDVGTLAKQRQLATITRHRLTHLHETEYITHIDDDIFFVLLKEKQASPMFAEAAIERLNSQENVGSLELMSYWFGPSMNLEPQKLMTQNFLWKDPSIGPMRMWRGTKQNNRLAITRSVAVDRTHLTHDYALRGPYSKVLYPKADDMYFNHYKFRSKAEYKARMDAVGVRGSWAWTSLAINGNKAAIEEDIWELGHTELDKEMDYTMLVFGPSLEWLLAAGPKYLETYVNEERLLLQEHLDRSRPLVHFVLPALVKGIDSNIRTDQIAVAAACALESTVNALKNSHDVWVWRPAAVAKEIADGQFGVLLEANKAGVDSRVSEIITAVVGNQDENKPRVMQVLIPELLRNTPFDKPKLVDGSKPDVLTRAVHLTIAHKYGGLVLDGSVAMRYASIAGSVPRNNTDNAVGGGLNATDFLSRYNGSYGYFEQHRSTDNILPFNEGLVLSVHQRRHAAIWAELGLLAAGTSSRTFRSSSKSREEFLEWPASVFAQLFVKPGQGSKSAVVLNVCGELARDGWDHLCPNTVAWANCKT